MTRALYIGRFQPFHVGHLSVLEEVCSRNKEAIIGIGSSQYHHTKENPFTFEERKQMIERSFRGNYSIFAVPDIHNYARWADHVMGIVGDFDVIYSGNEIVREIMEKHDKKVIEPKTVYYISATEIRNMVVKDADWKRYLPQGTIDTMTGCGGVKRIKELFKDFKNPYPTVDTIIRYNGGVVLVKRRHEPIGWALPGGFVDYGESLEDAAVRESKEETGLDVKLVAQLHTYSDPKRDLRKHTITTVYIADAIGGVLKGADDAEEAKSFALEQIPSLVLGHNLFIDDYKLWLRDNEKKV